MKKKPAILIVMFVLFIMPKSFGQDTLKAVYHEFSTELNVNLFQGQLTFNNALNQIKVRYMLSDDYALRLGVTAESEHVVNNQDLVYGTNPIMDNEKGSSTAIGLNFGIEKHFKGTKRLSPYIGAELALGYRWTSYEIDQQDLTTNISGSWEQITLVQQSNGYYSEDVSYPNRGYFSFGLNLVTGFDYYFAKHMFIGYEFEFGFTQQNYTDINVTYSGSDSQNQSPSPTVSTKNFSFGPSIINGIRIGYIF